jgi:hypothetical protein
MLQHWILSALIALCIGSYPGYAQDTDEPKDKTPGINSDLVSVMKFRGIGPAFMSGRIGDIAVDPVNRSIWYVVAYTGVLGKT